MTDADDHGSHDSHGDARTTAPQSDYSSREVGIGAAVTLVGVALAYLGPGLLI